MRYLATYLMLKLSGQEEVSKDEITKVLAGRGIDVDEARLNQLMGELDGKDIEEIIAEGSSLLAQFGSGGGGGGAGGGDAGGDAGGDGGDEPKKEEKVEEEIDMGGAMDMFGGGGDGY